MPMSAQNWQGGRIVKTCTECKQVKLRCDSRAKYPEPCSRCQAKRLTCTVDPAFRRTPARQRLEAMSKELEELRSRRSVDDGERSMAHSSPGPLENGNTPHSSTSSASHDCSLDMEYLELDGVFIDVQAAVDAFEIFADYFLPQLPILGAINARIIYQESHLLFWTIIVIVTSRIPKRFESDLFQQLRIPYDVRIKNEVLIAPVPLHKIQVLLYLCMWPLPVDHQPQDPSWLYCGIALNSALYMGLHRPTALPSLHSVGVVSGNSEQRSRTWLGCFYIATSLSMHLGFPPPINTPGDLASMELFLSKVSLPPDFLSQFQIQRIIARHTQVLPHTSNDVVDVSLLRLLDGELAALQTATSPRAWVNAVELSTLNARLHFYVMVITRTRHDAALRAPLLKSGLAAAIRVVHLATSAPPQVTHSPRDFGLTLPMKHLTLSKNHFRGLVFATVFLLRYFSLNSNAFPEEQQTARNHVSMTHSLLKECSVHPQDEMGRTAAFLEALARQAPANTDTSQLRVKERMGVSILLDAVSAASEVRGKPVEISEENQHDAPVHHGDDSQISNHDFSIPELQVTEPWLGDMDFSSEFWNDPMWNVFTFEGLPMQ